MAANPGAGKRDKGSGAGPSLPRGGNSPTETGAASSAAESSRSAEEAASPAKRAGSDGPTARGKRGRSDGLDLVDRGCREHYDDADLYDFEYRRRRGDVQFY